MYNSFSSNPELVNCTLIGNTAFSAGAMQNGDSSSPTAVNCLFSGNTSDSFGGVMVNIDSTPTLINCTLSGNSAATGGAIYSLNSPQVVVANCIVWGNGPDPLVLDNSFYDVDFSDVEGGFGGTANINLDPLFIDADGPDDILGTEDDDLRLQPGSPCIDAGDNTAVPKGNTTDLDGNPRFVDDPNTPDCQQAPGQCGDPPVVDMGAYEFQGTSCPADINGDGSVGILDLLDVLGAWGACP